MIRQSRINPRSVLAAVTLGLLVSTMLPSRFAAMIARPAASAMNFVLNPLTAPMTRMGARVRSPGPLPREQLPIEMLRQRHDELVQENEMLRLMLIEAARQLTEYEQIDEYGVRYRFNLEGLRRIYAPVTQSYNHRLEVSQGSSRGMREGLYVVHGPNLVGVVSNTTPMSATIQLITAPDGPGRHELQVRIIGSPTNPERTGVEMPLQLVLKEDGSGFWGQCRVTDPIAEGDLAIMADRRWRNESHGFFVGQVTKVEPDPRDRLSFRRVTVTPLVPLQYLDHVVALIPAQE